MALSLRNSRPFWANPVIVRDMRVRMRGTRAFWNQALYLGLLSLIVVLGYASSARLDNGDTIDPVSVQEHLHQFYYWIFEALAILITLVAPALTAVSIISEKKQQTLDLLVTTPMTSMQMLSGKLISSIAFIVLLLVLSVPASALCLVLGGATLSDVLQSYLLLTIDGVLMAAIGLSFSCSAKQPIQAIAGAYGAIILLLIITAVAGESLMTTVYSMVGRSHTAAPAIAALFELNPFFAATYPGFSVSIFGLTAPVWLATAVATAIMVRMILTGAALRLGMYGVGLVASLRRQTLVAILIATFIIGQTIEQIGGSFSRPMFAQIAVNVVASAVFAIALFFLPALFVPVVDEEGAPGQSVEGSYDLRQAFGERHSGGLPYFHIWLLFTIGGTVAGMIFPSGPKLNTAASISTNAISTTLLLKPLMIASAYTFFYLSGIGFLYWSLARRAAWLSTTAAVARPLNFFLFAVIVLAPCAVMLIMSQTSGDYDAFSLSPVRFFWILYPYAAKAMYSGHVQWRWFLSYGVVGYILGTLIYPFWWKVIPGAAGFAWKRKKGVAGIA